MKAVMLDIQTQMQIIMLEGLASGNRQERASGDAMTLAFLTTARDAILNAGGDEMNLFCIHNPSTITKIAGIAESTSGNSIFQRYDYSQSEWLKLGVIGDILGMRNITTALATIDDDWSGRESGVYGSLYFDASAISCGINKRPEILTLDVLANPGREYNMQYFWGAGVVESDLVAGIKMYES